MFIRSPRKSALQARKSIARVSKKQERPRKKTNSIDHLPPELKLKITSHLAKQALTDPAAAKGYDSLYKTDQKWKAIVEHTTNTSDDPGSMLVSAVEKGSTNTVRHILLKSGPKIPEELLVQAITNIKTLKMLDSFVSAMTAVDSQLYSDRVVCALHQRALHTNKMQAVIAWIQFEKLRGRCSSRSREGRVLPGETEWSPENEIWQKFENQEEAVRRMDEAFTHGYPNTALLDVMYAMEKPYTNFEIAYAVARRYMLHLLNGKKMDKKTALSLRKFISKAVQVPEIPEVGQNKTRYFVFNRFLEYLYHKKLVPLAARPYHLFPDAEWFYRTYGPF